MINFHLIILLILVQDMNLLLVKKSNSKELERRLSHRDELEEDYANERQVTQMKLMMTNMKRDGEIKGIEMALNEIGD